MQTWLRHVCADQSRNASGHDDKGMSGIAGMPCGICNHCNFDADRTVCFNVSFVLFALWHRNFIGFATCMTHDLMHRVHLHLHSVTTGSALHQNWITMAPCAKEQPPVFSWARPHGDHSGSLTLGQSSSSAATLKSTVCKNVAGDQVMPWCPQPKMLQVMPCCAPCCAPCCGAMQIISIPADIHTPPGLAAVSSWQKAQHLPEWSQARNTEDWTKTEGTVAPWSNHSISMQFSLMFLNLNLYTDSLAQQPKSIKALSWCFWKPEKQPGGHKFNALFPASWLVLIGEFTVSLCITCLWSDHCSSSSPYNLTPFRHGLEV